mmetsp:Transcript_7061/g.14454  ORF Transcript_7061/g.14454 Transcript_7061/m.14454 type:complete len:206 (+) Transcript_7061:76-693(+)
MWFMPDETQNANRKNERKLLLSTSGYLITTSTNKVFSLIHDRSPRANYSEPAPLTLPIALLNWPAREFAALNHMKTKPERMTARYGVAAARLPTPKIRTCWIKAPPDLPRGFPITSIAALPLVLDSLSRGMYAISLHGSNKLYLEDFDMMFWAAPRSTASISGVVPARAATGARAGAKMLEAKKPRPVTPIIAGVTKAATRHPNF